MANIAFLNVTSTLYADGDSPVWSGTNSVWNNAQTSRVVSVVSSLANSATTAQGATFAPTAVGQVWRASAFVGVTTSGSINMTVTFTYRDSNNSTRTDTFDFSSATGVASSAIANTGRFYSIPAVFRTGNTGVNISVVTAGTVTGSTYDFVSTIERLA